MKYSCCQVVICNVQVVVGNRSAEFVLKLNVIDMPALQHESDHKVKVWKITDNSSYQGLTKRTSFIKDCRSVPLSPG